MTDRRPRTVLTVLVLVALTLVTLDYRGGGTGPLGAMQRGADAVFAPVQEGAATVLRPVTGVLGAIGDLGRLRTENEQLRADLEELRGLTLSQAAQERELADLRAQLGLRERLQLTSVGANVIAQPPGASPHSVLIDIGADQGVTAGMAVIAADGLVGRVLDVTAGQARVQLLTSPEARVNARVADTGDQGYLTGRGSQPFTLQLRNPQAAIDAEAELVTQLSGGSRMPDGLRIGAIRFAEPGNLNREVVPFVDFSRLRTVQVVVDAPEVPADLDEGAIVAEPEDRRPPPANDPARSTPTPTPSPDADEDG